MKLRLTLLTVLAVALGASPAHAAVLYANKQCYREADPLDPVIFTGGPFTPGGFVNVSRDGLPIGELQATLAGIVSGTLTRPPIIDPARERRFSLVATDQRNPALIGTLTRLVSRLDVTVRPTGGRPSATRRITARGFTGGRRLYAHIVRGRRARVVGIGPLTGPCGKVDARKRLFRERQKSATYRVQFDSSRRYSSRTYPRLAFRVRIFTILRPRASAAGAERWVRID